MTLDIAGLGPAVFAPSRRPDGSREGNHFVQLYDQEFSLIDAVTTFFITGIRRGDGAIAIADQAHLAAFEEALRGSGVHLDALRSGGRYVEVDGEALLDQVLVGDTVDVSTFSSVVGDLIDDVALSTGAVRIFGEMVAMMWAGGNVAGAIALEEAWNELAMRHPFQLFCAYPALAFEQEHLESLTEVCRQHTHVIPPSA